MNLPDYYEFICPVKTCSGKKALANIPFELKAMDAHKPLMIADSNATEHGLVKHVINAFKDSGLTLGIYDGKFQSTDIKIIKELTDTFNNRGYDSIIALGNSDIVDIAKALNIVISGKPEDLKTSAGENKIKKHLSPFILIPTSSGTGFESTGCAFACGLSFSSPFLMPDLVVIDPEILLPQKPEIIAQTAMTAFAHAIEAVISPLKNPLADSYALAAVGFINNNLINAIKCAIEKPKSTEGLLPLTNGAMMAGYAFSGVSFGIIQAMAKEISLFSKQSYSICASVVFPYALGCFIGKNDKDVSDLLLTMQGADLYAGTPEPQRSFTALGEITALQNELYKITDGAIPRTLADMAISRENLTQLADNICNGDGESFNKATVLLTLEHAFDGNPFF